MTNKSNNTRKPFTFLKVMHSFIYAWRGIVNMMLNEHNAWIHSIAAVGVVIAGLCFGITRMEWIIIILCIGLVFAAEAFNTAIERLANVVSPDWNEMIGKAKDLAAGAVLLISVAVAIVGLIVFIPYIF